MPKNRPGVFTTRAAWPKRKARPRRRFSVNTGRRLNGLPCASRRLARWHTRPPRRHHSGGRGTAVGEEGSVQVSRDSSQLNFPRAHRDQPRHGEQLKDPEWAAACSARQYSAVIGPAGGRKWPNVALFYGPLTRVIRHRAYRHRDFDGEVRLVGDGTPPLCLVRRPSPPSSFRVPRRCIARRFAEAVPRPWIDASLTREGPPGM